MVFHDPVMIKETKEYLQVKKDGVYVDCTLGDGGHALEILAQGGIVIGLDVNAGSIKRAKKRIFEAGFENRISFFNTNFKNLIEVLKENRKVNGIVYDLGYSSTQLEDAQIGMSFIKNQPLDMRLDATLGVTAADLVNVLSEKDLMRLFSEYGDELLAARYARAIVKYRNLKKFQTTADLANLLVAVASPGYENGRIHPATRVFQALRIAVNSELDNLKSSLPQAARLLLPGSRMIVISFHSLEDRVVKEFGHSVRPSMIQVTKKPLEPSSDEVFKNPRARSAKMRVLEKI